MRLILGSSSPRRIELISVFELSFEVIPSSAEELHDHSLAAADLCITNARLKAQQVSSAHPGALVLGADTLVTRAGRHYGKPRDLTEARSFLEELSGRTHQVVTGVALLGGTGQDAFAVETQVTFRQLSPADVDTYLRLVPVLDKAGAYAVQEQGHLIIERVEGSLSNVIGLSLEGLADLFLARGLITQSLRDRIVAAQTSWSPQT